jgi:hypothetical protein
MSPQERLLDQVGRVEQAVEPWVELEPGQQAQVGAERLQIRPAIIAGEGHGITAWKLRRHEPAGSTAQSSKNRRDPRIVIRNSAGCEPLMAVDAHIELEGLLAIAGRPDPARKAIGPARGLWRRGICE